MRLNENVKIVGKRVILVPYEAKFVPKYHGWMQSTELQELTASSPLTLEQEYEMQKTWRNDDDKLTFLIQSRNMYESGAAGNGNRELDSLVGDTNLFLHKNSDDDAVVAEAEIMIAERDVRGKGYGWEAMLLMFKWALSHLAIQRLEVKVGVTNERSLRMFKKMHFKECSVSDVFQEVTLNCTPKVEWLQWLDSQVELVCEDYRSSS